MQEYPNFLAAIKGVCEKWCQQNGYTEPFCRNGEYWAFPPNGAIPVKIRDIIQTDKRQAQLVCIGRVSFWLLPDGSLQKSKE